MADRCLDRTRWAGWLCVAMLALWCSAENAVLAQLPTYADVGQPPPAGLELLQEEPHDLVYFTEAAGGGWAKTHLLELPNRKLPDEKQRKDEVLRMNIVGIEGQPYAARWQDIAKVDLWEERLERETKELIAANNFTGAYPFLAILIRDYPARPGLMELRSDFLLRDAVQRFKNGELGPSLAMLEELRRIAPDYKFETVINAISGITDRLLEQLLKDNKLDLAQKLLARLERDYRSPPLESIKKWNEIFLKMAAKKRA